jgi:hypothetical protein
LTLHVWGDFSLFDEWQTILTFSERRMAFYYLLLGHLIGDFALQTNRMAEYKGVHWKWNLLHVFVVTACTALLSYSYGALLLSMVLINGAIHFFMDYYKNKICRALHLSELSGFLFDQLIHIALLYIVSNAAVYGAEQLVDFKTVKILIALMLATYFSAVFTQFVLGAIFPRTDSRFFKQGEKYIGILTRVFGAVVFYISFIISPYYLLLFAVPSALFYHIFKSGWNKWMSPSHLVIKLLLDTVISAVCILPILF